MTCVICFLLLIWYIYILKFLPSLHDLLHTKNLKILNKTRVLKICDNGDLLFLSGASPGENMIKWCTASYVSHIAFLFRENGILYVWEADIGQNKKEGARVSTFVDKLKYWKGEKIGIIKRWMGNRPLTKDILNIIKTLFDKKMDSNMMAWLVANYRSLHSFFRSKDDVFCSEIIAMTLQKLQMIAIDHDPVSYSPQSFFSDSIKTINGTYGFPSYFAF
jgi:hypothetical protein